MANRTSSLGPISDESPCALYRQIVSAVQREIAAGHLAAGEPLPSFRTLARELSVSLITVKRAYAELEREGIVHRRQGAGTFVMERSRDLTRAQQRAVARAGLVAVVLAGKQAGLSNRQLQQMMREALQSAARGSAINTSREGRARRGPGLQSCS